MADDSKDEELAEEVEAEAKPEEEVLGQGELVAHLRSGREPVIVEGCRVQGLSGADYQRFQARQGTMAWQGGTGDRAGEIMVSEAAAWLAFGVLEPKMDYERWLFELEEADGGKIGRIVAKIKELSGVGQVELELAKKVYGQILADTQS